MDAGLDQLLQQNGVRFMATMHSIFTRYNRPFEDDALISMETLTYDTPQGPKSWEKVSPQELRRWRKTVFKQCCGGSQSNAEVSAGETTDFENVCSTLHQESPENSCMDASDVGEDRDDSIVSVRSKCQASHLQNQYAVNRKRQEKVKVDVIVQERARNIPEWFPRVPQCSSEGLHLPLPVPEPKDNQVAVCRKEVELSHASSSSRPLQLQFSDVLVSPNTITIPRHRPYPELNKTYCDSILEEYQSDEEFSSNVTIADLYPAMVELLKRLMVKQPWRKQLKYTVGQLRHKRWYSRRPKLSVPVDKIRGFRTFKLKRALPSICSSRSEDTLNQTCGNKNRELCDDKCSINDLSMLVPYSDIHTNDSNMNCTDSSLEHHLVSGKSPKIFKQTVFPNVMASMGETFLVEDELQTTVSLKNSECKESEKLAYKCSSECRFVTSTASSGSAALHLVKESKTQKNDFPSGDSSVLCSSTCSSYGNSNTCTPVTNSSLTRASNPLLINPGKIIAGRRNSFHFIDSFSSSSVKLSPSMMSQKSDDAFEELYYKLCCEDSQKPLTLTRPLPDSHNFEEKGRLVKRNLNTSVRSDKQCDEDFDRIYKELCCDTVPKHPEFLKALNLRKFDEVHPSETVKALVSSPVRNSFSVLGIKRLRNFQNDRLCSPLKRLKNISEYNFPSTTCQQISPRGSINLQTVGMDFLSTYNHSNSSFFDHHNCQSQDSGFHASSDKTLDAVVLPCKNENRDGCLREPKRLKPADLNTGRKVSMDKTNQMPVWTDSEQKISRKLSNTDGKHQKPSNPLDSLPVKTHRGAFMDCYRKNSIF